MKKLVLILISLLFIITLSAEEKLTKSLGFAGGLISGSGFAYRQISENKGFQITFGAISYDDYDCHFPETYPAYSDDHSNYTDDCYGRETFANIGATYIKPLHQSEKSMFYLLGGAALYYSAEDYSEQLYVYNEASDLYMATGESTESTDTSYIINVGAGFGIEYKLTENIRISLDWPIVASKDSDHLNITMAIPQGAIQYYFK